MLHFPVHEISMKLQKKLLIGGVIPRPIALVVTQNDKGLVNLAPFSYFNIVSFDPPVLMIAVQRKADGSYKDTARNLLNSGEASVHIVTESMLIDANETAAPLSADESELIRTQWQLRENTQIAVPAVATAPITYESRYREHLPISREEKITADVFLLSVVSTAIDDAIFDTEKEYLIADTLAPMSRLAGQDYATLGKQITLKRPTR